MKKSKGPTEKTMHLWEGVKPDTMIRSGDWVRALEGPGVGSDPDPWEPATGLVGIKVDQYDSQGRSVMVGTWIWQVVRLQKGSKA